MGTNDTGHICFAADDDDNRRRLDAVVARHLSECSRTRAAGLIRAGDIQLNRLQVKPSQRVSTGDEITMTIMVRNYALRGY